MSNPLPQIVSLVLPDLKEMPALDRANQARRLEQLTYATEELMTAWLLKVADLAPTLFDLAVEQCRQDRDEWSA